MRQLHDIFFKIFHRLLFILRFALEHSQEIGSQGADDDDDDDSDSGDDDDDEDDDERGYRYIQIHPFLLQIYPGEPSDDEGSEEGMDCGDDDDNEIDNTPEDFSVLIMEDKGKGGTAGCLNKVLATDTIRAATERFDKGHSGFGRIYGDHNDYIQEDRAPGSAGYRDLVANYIVGRGV